MSHPPDPSIAIRDLCYVYPDGQAALHNLSFTIHRGEKVAVIGANGAGKSTLLLHLNGVLIPSRGEVRIGHQLITTAITRHHLAAVRHRVGMIFQDADDQLFMPSVFEDVAFGPGQQGWPPAVIETRVMQALATVGAAHLRDRPPYRLSGGEKRAVAIAGVLVMQPDILVMDEPSSGLDPRARRRLIELLARIDHTQIIATHDLDLVLDLCSRVLILHEGRLAADGPAADLLADLSLLDRCNLEVPLSQSRRR